MTRAFIIELLFVYWLLNGSGAQESLRTPIFQKTLGAIDSGYSHVWNEDTSVGIMESARPYGGERIEDREKWILSCDSFEKGDECTNAIDGNARSLWHTAWDTTVPLPHHLTIDLAGTEYINGVEITPRRDGNTHGWIAGHEVYTSLDGWDWGDAVAYGTWFGDTATKFSVFEAIPARYIRLVATSEAFGRNWTSVAEVNIWRDLNYSAPPTDLGKWGPTIDFPLVPAGAWVDPVSGNVVTFASADHDQIAPVNQGKTFTATWDSSLKAVSERMVNETHHDMFCPGLSMDANGRTVVTGGNDATKTSIYNFSSKSWETASEMTMGRGYQGQVTTSDGRIFVIGGSWRECSNHKTGEIYSTEADAWTRLDGCPVGPMLTSEEVPKSKSDCKYYRADNHGWLFGWKNGTVFQAGPSKKMNWYNVSNSGNVRDAGVRGSNDTMCGVAVMYDAFRGKILAAGGAPTYEKTTAVSTAFLLQLEVVNSNVTWEHAPPMSYNRVFHNAVILPNGDTFVTGGQQIGLPFTDNNPQLIPEIYSPGANQWTKMAPNSIVRAYHSFALLLPDATILTGGGGLCRECDGIKDAPVNHFDGQIYTPPYLLTRSGTHAIRPVITKLLDSTVKLGEWVTFETDTSVAEASIIRYGSATHGLNTDQRRIPLYLWPTHGNQYRIQVPSEPGVAIPGYWMLFVMDFQGVPSVAQTLHIRL